MTSGSTKNALQACRLCPRECGASRSGGRLGFCGATDDIEIGRAAPHMWEEPVISGKAGSGTIFFAHCSLGCAYCQNRLISGSSCDVPTRTLSIEDLALCMIALEKDGVMNINLVTPTHYGEQIRGAIRLARKMGLSLPIVWNSSGYELASEIARNSGLVDVYLVDFKYANSHLAGLLSGATDYPEVALSAIEAMVEDVGNHKFDEFEGVQRMTRGVIIRHLVLPGLADESKTAIELLFSKFGNRAALSIMSQYTPVIEEASLMGDEACARALREIPSLARQVSAEEYEEVLDFADSLGIEGYYWQDGQAASESFIPEFGFETTRTLS